MDTPGPPGADDLASWLTGNRIAWDLMASRHAPSTALPQDDDEPGNPFEMLMELLDRMPTELQTRRRTGAVAAVNDTGAAFVDDDAYRNGGFGAVPASSEAIAGLPEISAGDAGEQDCCTCTVCLQDFEGGDKLRRLPCFHSFHERCIFDWLRISRACPLCRHLLPMERH